MVAVDHFIELTRSLHANVDIRAACVTTFNLNQYLAMSAYFLLLLLLLIDFHSLDVDEMRCYWFGSAFVTIPSFFFFFVINFFFWPAGQPSPVWSPLKLGPRAAFDDVRPAGQVSTLSSGSSAARGPSLTYIVDIYADVFIDVKCTLYGL